MKNPNLAEKFSVIKSIISLANKLSENDEMQAHWAKYICVLASGFIEECLGELYREYCMKQKIPATISQYLQSKFKRGYNRDISNLTYDKILALTSSFSEKWKGELDDWIDDEKKGSISSITNNRNKIAHGGSSDVTLTNIEEWLEDSVEVMEFIEEMLNRELAVG